MEICYHPELKQRVYDIQSYIEKDKEYAATAEKETLNAEAPKVGDTVIFDDKVSRITKIYQDGEFQISKGGSFYLYEDGNMSFSGSLSFDLFDIKNLTEHTPTKQPVWFFTVSETAGANKGAHTEVLTKTWTYKDKV